MRECKEFFEGDRVMIVSEPYLDCPFTWVDEMTRMCGKVVTISGKRYNDAYGTYCYEIKEDVNRFCWCSNCFTLLEPEEELPEIEDDSFLVAIHMGGGETP